MSNRLPVNPNRLEVDRIEYTLRNWDQTPKISTIREIDRILPEISCMAANEITRRADQNEVRTVIFNLTAVRDFENEDFGDVVQFVADYIEFRLYDNAIRNAEQDLERSVDNAVRLFAAGLIDQYRELKDIVDDNRSDQYVREWDKNIGLFREVTREIENMHREDQSTLRRGGTSQAYSGRNGRDDRSSRDDRGTRSSTRGDGAVSRERGSRERDYPESRGSRGDRDRYEPETRNNGRPINNDDFPEFNTTQPIKNERVGFTEELTEEAREIVSNHLLTNTVTVEDDGTMFMGEFGAIPLLIPKGKTEMEMYDHARIYSRGIADAPDMAKEIIRVLTATQAVKAEGVTAEEIKDDVVVDNELELFDTVSSMCNMVSNLATVNSIKNAGENIEGRREIYHKVAVVGNTFIGHLHLTDFHNSLRTATTFREVLDKLKRSVNAVNEQASPDAAYATDVRAAVEFYDRLLADEVSQYCTNVLRIKAGDPTKPLLTSVIDSYDELMDHFGDSGQENLKSALAGFTSSLMVNLNCGWDPTTGVAAGVLSDMASLGEDNQVNLGHTYFPMGYVLTHLPFTMKEVGYDIKEPVAIDDKQATSFLKAALDISATEIATAPVINNPVRLLMTRDRKVYRMYRYPGRFNATILCPYNIR